MRKIIKILFFQKVKKAFKNTNPCLKNSLYVGTASNLIFCSPLQKPLFVLCCVVTSWWWFFACDLKNFLFHSIDDRKEGKAYLCMPSFTWKTFSVGGMHHFTLELVRVCVSVCVCVCQGTIILAHLFSCEVQNSSLSFSLIHSAIYCRHFLPFLWNRILKLYSCVSFRYSSIFCDDFKTFLECMEHQICLCLEIDYFSEIKQ